jgi:hypothetical protein
MIEQYNILKTRWETMDWINLAVEEARGRLLSKG